MRLKLIACEVFYREMCAAVVRSPNVVDIEFLPQGLHDIGAAGMRARIQEALDRVQTTHFDAVALGYGLCNNGLAGLTARDVPLVLPKAHDCITLFLGSTPRYLEYFNANPGVYFKTTGWLERGQKSGELSQLSVAKQSGLNQTYGELVAKYGEDNARYLYEMLGDDKHNYSQFTFIEMGVEPDNRFEHSVEVDAKQRGWRYEKVRGDMGMIQRLVDGAWDESEFLVVPPGHQIVPRYDGQIVAAEPADGAAL